MVETKVERLSRYDRLLHVVQFGILIAKAMAKERSEDLMEKSIQLIGKSTSFLADNSDVSAEGVRQALQAESVPDEFPDRLFFFAMQQLNILVSMRTAAKISSAVIPTLLEEFPNNPDASDEDLRACLAVRIREGKLSEF